MSTGSEKRNRLYKSIWQYWMDSWYSVWKSNE